MGAYIRMNDLNLGPYSHGLNIEVESIPSDRLASNPEEDKNFYFGLFGGFMSIKDGITLYFQFVFRKNALKKIAEIHQISNYNFYTVEILDDLISGDAIIQGIDKDFKIEIGQEGKVLEIPEFYFCKKIRILTEISLQSIFQHEDMIQSLSLKDKVSSYFIKCRNRLQVAIENRESMQKIHQALLEVEKYGTLDNIYFIPFFASSDKCVAELKDIPYIEEFIILLIEQFPNYCREQKRLYEYTAKALLILYSRANTKLETKTEAKTTEQSTKQVQTIHPKVMLALANFQGSSYDVDESICSQLPKVHCRHENCIRRKSNLMNQLVSHNDPPNIFTLRYILNKNTTYISREGRSEIVEYTEELDPLILKYLRLDFSNPSELEFFIATDRINHRMNDDDEEWNVLVQKIGVISKSEGTKQHRLTTKFIQCWYDKYPRADYYNLPGIAKDFDRFSTEFIYIFAVLYKNPTLIIPHLPLEFYETFPKLYELIYKTKPLKYCLPFVKTMRLEDATHLDFKYGLRPCDVLESIREGYFVNIFTNRVGNHKARDYLQDITFSSIISDLVGYDAFCKGSGDLTDEFDEAFKSLDPTWDIRKYFNKIWDNKDVSADTLKLLIDTKQIDDSQIKQIESLIVMGMQLKEMQNCPPDKLSRMDWYVDDFDLVDQFEKLSTREEEKELWEVVQAYEPSLAERSARIIAGMIQINFLCYLNVLQGIIVEKNKVFRQKFIHYATMLFVDAVKRDNITQTFDDFPPDYAPDNHTFYHQ